MLRQQSAESEALSLPAGWSKASLREVCTKASLVDPIKTPEREFDYVDVSSVSAERLMILGTTKVKGAAAPSRARKVLRTGDVIFATVRPTLRRIALVPPQLDGQLASTAFCVIRANTTVANPAFLYFVVVTRDFVDRVGALQRGASYPAVTDGDVLDRQILVPPLEEQRAIAGVLSKLQGAINAQDRIVASLKELKAATMAKLFREGLRSEPLKQTEIGEIPESWDLVSMEDVANIPKGQVDPRREPYAEMVHIGPEDVEEATGRLLSPRTAREIGLISGKYAFRRGDIVFSKIRPYLRKSVLADFDGVCSADMYPLRPKEGFDASFLHAVTLSEPFTRQATAQQARTGIPKVNRQQLNTIIVPRPTLREQRDMGNCCVAFAARFEVALRRREVLRALFSSMLSPLMTGQLRVAVDRQGVLL